MNQDVVCIPINFRTRRYVAVRIPGDGEDVVSRVELLRRVRRVIGKDRRLVRRDDDAKFLAKRLDKLPKEVCGHSLVTNHGRRFVMEFVENKKRDVWSVYWRSRNEKIAGGSFVLCRCF